MLRHPLAIVLGCALAVGTAACLPSRKGEEPVPPDGGATASRRGGGGPVGPGGSIVRDGYFIAQRATKMRLGVTDVQRLGQSSVLRLAVTSLDAEPVFGVSLFGAGRVDLSLSGFSLVDPVGRKLYRTLRAGSSTGSAFGSFYRKRLTPQVRYEGHVYFPALPPEVRRVTVLTPGTTAEMPGVPVVDGTTAPAAPTEQPLTTPSAGQTVAFPAKPPTGTIWRETADLHDLVEGREAATTSGGGAETITFPADVLFAFDSATLSARAQQVVARAAADLKNRADPAKPVDIEGHTDGKGLRSHNQPLSERRAAAVRDALRRVLGEESPDGFQVAGKADTEPIAKETTAGGADNPAGRARNRRVEISYALRPATDEGSPSTSSPGVAKRGDPGPPASFRRDDGRVVAERTAAVETPGRPDSERFRLRVHPFYRDGNYLAVVFELTNIGDRKLGRPLGFRGHFRADDFVGGDYGSFRVLGGDGTVYRGVRRGVPDEGQSGNLLSGAIILDEPNLPGRTYMYVPAPPRGTSSVTFDAGAFGKIPNVPVE
jgi:outer membrane protein OmpA-like peptidoglycan-associated protein